MSFFCRVRCYGVTRCDDDDDGVFYGVVYQVSIITSIVYVSLYKGKIDADDGVGNDSRDVLVMLRLMSMATLLLCRSITE